MNPLNELPSYKTIGSNILDPDPVTDPGWDGSLRRHEARRRDLARSGGISKTIGTALGNLTRSVNSTPIGQATTHFAVPALAVGLASKYLGGSSNKSSLIRALVAGGGGLGLMAWLNSAKSNESLSKSGSYSDPMTVILTSLSRDPNLSSSAKESLATKLGNLPSHMLSNLASILAMAGGAAAGSIIAKFLLGGGMPARVLGGLLGAYAGNNLVPFKNTTPQRHYYY